SSLTMSLYAFQVPNASWMNIPGVFFCVENVVVVIPIASVVVVVMLLARNRLAKSVSMKYSNEPNSVPPTSRRVRRMNRLFDMPSRVVSPADWNCGCRRNPNRMLLPFGPSTRNGGGAGVGGGGGGAGTAAGGAIGAASTGGVAAGGGAAGCSGAAAGGASAGGAAGVSPAARAADGA